MPYTSYEMVSDCRAGVPAGWRYFVRQYVPAVRRILLHYRGTVDGLEAALAALTGPESNVFQSLEPAPERPFLAELRQRVLAGLDFPAPALDLDLEAVAAAWGPLTLVEKQAAWLETMRYSPAETAEMLRMSAATVQKIRSRAAELVRGQVDSWNAGLLPENGPQLGRAAAAARSKDCLPAKTFLDVLDGRTSWRGREQMEQHVLGCWYCIDHFCRLLEVVELLRGMQPLTGAEAAPFDALLNLPAEKPVGWRRWLAR